ncbi:FUSC family protein [Legionella gresilensis]|uniref:FUSC family protein n=1 Tax=Legionella gresilensis TaxID=91823 RepID=UPI001041A577|nr:FUSC family protein [Legionella gresilensis]
MNRVDFFKQFWPHSLENRAALRTAVGIVIAVVISYALHFEKPYWAGMTVAMVANIYTGNIIDKSIMRLLGTFIGVWAGFYLAHFIVNSFLLYFVINFFILAAATYYYNFSRYAYAYLLGGIGAFFVVGQLAMDPQSTFEIAIWRPVEIGLGVIVSAIVALFIFPNSLSNDVSKEITALFTAMDSLLNKVSSLYKASDAQLSLAFRQENLKVKKTIRKTSELIGFMHREFDNDKNRIDQFRFFTASLADLRQAIDYFNSLSVRSEKIISANLMSLTDVLFATARRDLTHLHQAFIERNVKVRLELPTLISNLENLSTLTTKEELAITHFFRQINTALLDLQKALSGISNQGQSNKLINNEQQLRNDPDVLMHSIKVGLTALVALALWMLSDWPGGLAGIISSIVISVKKNLFEMKNTSILRFLGALTGGGITISIMYWLPLNFYLLIMIIFLTGWGFSYLYFKSPAYSYLGLQANVAVLITLAQAGGPPVEVAAPLERLAGVIMGIIASFIVGNLIWRTDLIAMLQRQLKKLKNHLFYNCVTIITLRTHGILYDLTSLFWLCRSLVDTLSNETLRADKKARLADYIDTFKSAVLLQMSLKNILNTINQDQAEQTAAKLTVDLVYLEQAVAKLYQDPTVKNTDIKMQLEEAIATVLTNKSKETISVIEEENLVTYLHALIRLVEIRKNLRTENV